MVFVSYINGPWTAFHDPESRLVFMSVDKWDAVIPSARRDEDSIGASFSLHRIGAHEAGHFFDLSTRTQGDEKHDPGPFPAGTTGLMRAGESGPHGKWLRQEDWDAANRRARIYSQ